MNTRDIKNILSRSSNGHSHALSHSISRALSGSRSSRFSRSLPSFGSRRRSSSLSASGAALPVLFGVGALALIGAAVDFVLRRNSGQGILGMLGGEELKYDAVHGTTAAQMPEPQEG